MRRETTKGRIRIQKRVVKKRHGSKSYEYPVLSFTIPARFHEVFEKLLEFEFDVAVVDHGAAVRILLDGRQYQSLELMGIDLQLARERKLEILLRAHEGPDLQKLRSSYCGFSMPPHGRWEKYPDLDQALGQ